MGTCKNCLGEAVLASTHNLYFEQKYEKLEFLSENFQFWLVKFSIYVNRRIFIMNVKGTGHIGQIFCSFYHGDYYCCVLFDFK